MAASLDGVLLWLLATPGVTVTIGVVGALLIFRLLFKARIRVTLRQESRAVELERNKEHAARAASLRLVARGMTDDNEAA